MSYVFLMLFTLAHTDTMFIGCALPMKLGVRAFEVIAARVVVNTPRIPWRKSGVIMRFVNIVANRSM